MVDFDLSPDEFWELSWFEFGLYAMKAESRLKEANLMTEVNWAMVREIWLSINNRWRGKGEKQYKRSDFMKLSFDKTEGAGGAKVSKLLTPEEVEARFNKLKNRNGK